MSRWGLWVLACLAAITTLSSCAVLTIDVDVYKGPLSNERNVQLQQMAVMATAAKPLLIELRNRLESPRDPNEVRARAYYENAYMWGSAWENRHARTVNSILGLYEDQDALQRVPGPIASGYEALDRAVQRYFLVQARMDDTEGPRRVWEGLKAQVAKGGRAAGSGRELLDVYDSFFEPSGLEESHHDLDGVFRYHAAELATRLTPKSSPPSTGCGDRPTECYGGTALYALLAKGIPVRDDAAVLFADRPDKAREFVEAVSGVAATFLDLRASLVDVFRACLRLLPQVDAVSDLDLPTSKKNQLRRGVASFAAYLLKQTSLPSALDKHPGRNRSLETAIATAIRADADKNFEISWLTSPEHHGISRKGVERSLAELLASDPSVGAQLLQFQADLERGAAEANDHERQFGIVLGPTAHLESSEAQLAIADAWAACRLTEGLERGRLPDGLETIIDAYLVEEQQSNRRSCGGNGASGLCKREQDLLRAMVHFSTKVLDLVNNDALLRQRPEQENGWLPAMENFVDETLWRGRDNSIEVYTRLLQAVGNSIQVLANELQHYALDRQKSEGSELIAERNAILGSMECSVGGVINEIIAAIQTPSHDLLEHLDDVKDQRTKERRRAGLEADLARFQSAVEVAENQIKARSESLLNLDRFDAAKDDIVTKIFDSSKDDANNPKAIALDSLIKQIEEKLSPIFSAETWREVKAELVTSLNGRPNLTFFRETFDKRLANRRAELSPDSPWGKTLTDAKVSAQRNVDNTKTNLENLAKDSPAVDRRATVAKNAAEQIRAVRSSVEAQLAGTCSRQAVVTALKDALHRRVAGASSDDVPKLKDAIAVLDVMPVPAVAGREVDGNNALEVLDSLIAQLEHDHIQAVAALGSESPRAKYLAEATRAAYARRAGKIDLRPASSFLRSSLKATALQNDAPLRDHNMIARHGFSQLPFGSYILAGGPFSRSLDYETLQEIDKQFWQSVNRVKVAGAGDTNYVVAKDDVGNWYVKNMSADPEDIIRGAQSLALFGAGGGMGANLLALRPTPGAAKDPESSNAGPQSRAEAQVASFKKKYADLTVSHRDQLKEARATLKDRCLDQMTLADSAKSLKTALGTALDVAAGKTLKETTLTASTDMSVARREIVRGLREVLAFYRQSIVEIASSISLTEAKAAWDKAQKDLDETERKLKAAEEKVATLSPAAKDVRQEVTKIAGSQDSDATSAAVDATTDALDTVNDDLKKAKDKVAELTTEKTSNEKLRDDAKATFETREAGLAFAKRTLGEAVGAEMRLWIERRVQTASQYHTAMQVLGGVGVTEEGE